MVKIVIRNQEELNKYLKPGSKYIYEFKKLGLLANVKIKYDLFDTKNARENGAESTNKVILRANKIKAKSLVVDQIEADKIKAKSIVATYVFAKKVNCGSINVKNLEADKVRCTLFNGMILTARKVRGEYIDVCEIRNCSKIRAKAIKMLTMSGGKLRAGIVNLAKEDEEYKLPETTN